MKIPELERERLHLSVWRMAFAFQNTPAKHTQCALMMTSKHTFIENLGALHIHQTKMDGVFNPYSYENPKKYTQNSPKNATESIDIITHSY